MPKSSLPALVFNGVSLSIIRQNNQTYFSASDIAKSLGYRSDDAISRIYRRNADEFTADMSETVNLTVSGNIQKTVRLFSLRGAHLVAMFSRTSKAKKFRRWVLDILDKEAIRQAPAENTLPAVRVITTEEQTAINMRAHVLAQEKYREIRGELIAEYLAGRVDDLDSWVPEGEGADAVIDVANLMFSGFGEQKIDLPKGLTNEVEKKALEMAKECYVLCVEHLQRAIAYRCVGGDGLSVLYAKKVVRSSNLGNALAQRLYKEHRDIEASLEFVIHKADKALKKIQEGHQ